MSKLKKVLDTFWFRRNDLKSSLESAFHSVYTEREHSCALKQIALVG